MYIKKLDGVALLIADPPPLKLNWQNPPVQQNRRNSWFCNKIKMPFQI